jgi:hypothetical protein
LVNKWAILGPVFLAGQSRAQKLPLSDQNGLAWGGEQGKTPVLLKFSLAETPPKTKTRAPQKMDFGILCGNNGCRKTNWGESPVTQFEIDLAKASVQTGVIAKWTASIEAV